MSFHDDMRALAAEFTAGEMFGDAVLTRVDQHTGAFNPVTGAVAGGSSTTDVDCRAVFGSIKVQSENGKLCKMASVTIDTEIQAGDVVTIGSKSATVVEVVEIAPLGEAYLWKAVVK